MMNWPSDFINKIICGDCLEVMKKMPDECIDMVICSPPYWGLRDYGIEQIFGGDKECEHNFGHWENREKLIREHEKYQNTWQRPSRKEVEKISLKKKCPVCNNEFDAKPHQEFCSVKCLNTLSNEERTAAVAKQKTCLKCQAWKGQLGLEPTPEMYIEHLIEIFNEVKRVLKKEGTFWLNIGDTYWGGKGRSAHGDPERHIKRLLEGKTINKPYQEIGKLGEIKPGDGRHDFIQPKCLCMIPERLAWSLIQNGWILRNKIPWIKPNCMPFSGKDRFTNKWEHVFYFVKSRKNYFDLDSVREPHKEISKKRSESHRTDVIGYKGHPDGPRQLNHEKFCNPKGKNPGDVWIINNVPCPVKGIHFATFPEELCKKAIIPGCPKDGIVLDPFAGIGTACYVAQRLGRKFIGIDIKPEYCDKAQNIRLAQGVL